MVLMILAGVWALFLVPQVLRARTERPADSIGAFSRQLSVLGRTGASARSPQLPLFPMDALGPSAADRMTAADARRRRREVVKVLLAAIGATLVLGLLPPLRLLLVVHFVLDLLFAGYVFLLHQAHVAALERRATVRQLRARPEPSVEAEPEPEDIRIYGT
ncbi:MAG: hypothetical protein H0U26_04720 [Acidimicrobiia bacterium]|nr:hypothetical protein [Acidimicrobiia bacterium]